MIELNKTLALKPINLNLFLIEETNGVSLAVSAMDVTECVINSGCNSLWSCDLLR